MNSENMKKLMLQNAAEINRMHLRIHETYKVRRQGPEKLQEWKQACDDFHSRYEKLAWPVNSEPSNWLERIASGESESVEAALCFLECRPYFFRSGYMFKDILRKVKRAPMLPEQEVRLKIFLEKWAIYQGAKVKQGHRRFTLGQRPRNESERSLE